MTEVMRIAGTAPCLALSPRETEILVGMACGLTNADIGAQLYIAENTVKSHGRRLFKKLGARDRTHAVSIGYLSGLLDGTTQRALHSTAPTANGPAALREMIAADILSVDRRCRRHPQPQPAVCTACTRHMALVDAASVALEGRDRAIQLRQPTPERALRPAVETLPLGDDPGVGKTG